MFKMTVWLNIYIFCCHVRVFNERCCFCTHTCTSGNLHQSVKCWGITTPSEHISPKAANEDSRQTCQRELSGKMAGRLVMLISHVVQPYPGSSQTPWLVVTWMYVLWSAHFFVGLSLCDFCWETLLLKCFITFRLTEPRNLPHHQGNLPFVWVRRLSSWFISSDMLARVAWQVTFGCAFDRDVWGQ